MTQAKAERITVTIYQEQLDTLDAVAEEIKRLFGGKADRSKALRQIVNDYARRTHPTTQPPPGVPATIVGECPACHQPTTFTWSGTWSDVPEGIEPFEMYQCDNCGTTRSQGSINVLIDTRESHKVE